MRITHGKPGKFIKVSASNRPVAVRGYYLVLPSGDRHWIGESVYDAARDLNKLCDKYLTEESKWEYWIDFCMGYDSKCNLIWSNNDKTDDVLAAAERMGW